MSDLEAGQVLSLKIRFNNNGDISRNKHPYLIMDIDEELGVVELAQIDSIENKGHKVFFRGNKVISCTNPNESVIDKDSFVQLDNTIKIENFPELLRFRRQENKLSLDKFNSVLQAYHNYRNRYEIDDNKNVYIDKTELLSLN